MEEGSSNLIFGKFFAENCMKIKEIKPVGRGGEGFFSLYYWIILSIVGGSQ